MHHNKRITIIDIAKLCGVGKSTVSRVINNEAGVTDSTREKVRKVIKENNFIPSKSAQALRGYTNNVVGIIVTRLDSSAENQAIRAMFPLFQKNDIDTIILESQFDNQKLKEHIMMLENRQIDRLIVFAYTGLDFTLFSKWQSRLVMIARSFPDTVSICYDDLGAVNMLIRHLYYDKGKQNISFIGVEKNDQSTGLLRYEAYLQFCTQHHITPNAYLGKLNYITGYQYAKNAIDNGADAIICATDTIALGLNKYLIESGEKIVVASVGTSELLRFLFPQTICVELGFGQAGKIAALETIKLTNKNVKVNQGIKTIIVPSKILTQTVS